MSDTPLSNEELANLQIFPGGVTFGQAQEIIQQQTAPVPPVDEPKEDERTGEGGGGGGGGTKTAISTDQFVRGGRNILRTTYSDGTFTDEDLGAATSQTDSDAAFRAGQLAQQRSDAFSRLRTLLNRVGLQELEGAVQGVITSGTVDLGDPNAILFALREQPAYQRRFAGNAARARKGLPELDPSTYVGLEEQYRQLLRSNGLPVGFYDQTDDFQKFIEGDVSPQELQDRIQQGYRRVQDADPEVRRQMRELYKVDDNALAAYFLDPERAQPLLARQARAAEIAARGSEQARLQLTAAQAEELAARGITPEQAQAQFAQRGALEGLYQPMTGEEAFSIEQQLGATFGYDVQALEAVKRRQEQRVAQFKGGGSFAATTGATSGTIETGAGMAQ